MSAAKEQLVNMASDHVIQTILKEVQEKIKEWEETRVRIAITGLSGAGKSSLINAIANQKLAPVGVTETTVEAKEYDTHHGLTLVDLPGCGTQKFPFENYAEQMKLASFDAIVLVTSNRFYENDAKLYSQVCNELKIPCFVVRTKMDTTVIDAFEDNGMSEADVILEVTNNIKESLKPSNPEQVYLVSSRRRSQFDMTNLIESLCNSLPGLKRDKFRAEAAAYSKAAIEKKRPVVEEIAGRYAWAAAANGLNPVPGLNVAVDTTLLITMSTHILRFYGLTDESLKHIAGNLSGKARVQSVIQGVGRFAAQFAATAGVIQILKTFVGMATVKTIAVWIPFIGQAVSAFVGHKMTNAFAAKLIDESEEKAMELLDAVTQDGI